MTHDIPLAPDDAQASLSTFGMLNDGRAVGAVSLTNGHGVSAKVIALGATLQALVMPDRDGRLDDVHLGFDSAQDYIGQTQYFGATVGRFANRIAHGRFILDGRAHTVPVNDGANALHGGAVGFDKALWEIVEVGSGSIASVTLRHISPDGDMGFPGTLTVLATYSLDTNNQLTIDYRATTDRTTVVNITNHAYWALAGLSSERSAMDHEVMIAADRFLPVDAGLIPTGARASVQATPFDFRRPQPIDARVRDGREQQLRWAHGYDHCWMLADEVLPEPRLAARVRDTGSGRGFELWSNQTGLQFYSGNVLNGAVPGKAGRLYRMGDAFAMEPQCFPDAPNQPGFPSTRLDPGQTYRNRIVYKLMTSA